MSSRPPLLIATTNPGKLREWRQLLGDLPFELLDLADLGASFDVIETGRTFAENARLKAEAYSRATRLLTLAEDAGLSVRKLGGRPGVHSARWEGSDYQHKNRLLVRLLDGVEGPERACRYVCAVVLRHPTGREWLVRGEVRGEVAHEPRGTGGFGYDPIFYVPRLGRTLAEISGAVKDGISHRGRAAKRVRPVLMRMLEHGLEGRAP